MTICHAMRMSGGGALTLSLQDALQPHSHGQGDGSVWAAHRASIYNHQSLDARRWQAGAVTDKLSNTFALSTKLPSSLIPSMS